MAAAASSSSSVFESEFSSNISQLNSHLQVYGLPTLWFDPNTDKRTVSSVLTCVQSLLSQRQHDIAFRNEAADALRKSRAENEHIERRMKKAQDAAERAERELVNFKLKTQTVGNDQQKQREKTQTELQELQTKHAQTSYNMQQLNHKLLRQEKEIERLGEKVAKMLQDREAKVNFAPKMVLLSPDYFSPSRVSTTPVNVMRDLSDTYEGKLKEYREDLNKMQTSMSHFHDELLRMIGHFCEIPPEFDRLRESVFRIPYYISCDAIHEYFDSGISLLESALSTALAQRNQPSNPVNPEHQQHFSAMDVSNPLAAESSASMMAPSSLEPSLILTEDQPINNELTFGS